MLAILAPRAADQARLDLDTLLRELGPRRVLLAALAAMLRRQPRPGDASVLNDHLRRDIGLAPMEPRRDFLL